MKVQINLILGDCLKELRKIPDKSIDCVVTDPPYGIDYQSAWRTDTERFEKIVGDKEISKDWIGQVFRVLKDDTGFYCFTRIDVYPEWRRNIEEFGFIVKSVIVWDRVVHGLGDLNGAYAPCYDLIIFAVKGKPTFKNGRPVDVIRVPRVSAEKLNHPAAKPVKLMEHLIKNSTSQNDTVLDCFMGSGTAGVACKRLNRNFIGIEIDPKYFEIAKRRIENIPQRLDVFQSKKGSGR